VCVAEDEAQGSRWGLDAWPGNLSRALTPASRVKRPGGSERKITAARMVACLFLACSHRMIGNEGSSPLSDLSHVISASGRVK
jgi:hypothetical protein